MERKLHIGGKQKADSWEILNAVQAPYVNHVCNANDLSQFAENTFSEMYASHVIEHFDYQNELTLTLKEWQRVLIPGGKLYVSVPDLDTLADLFLQKSRLNIDERFFVMRMIFGGHVDAYDYHVVGLNEDFLTSYLKNAGYINILRVKEFGLFNDTSIMQYKDVLISLNMTAEKPSVYISENANSHK